VEALGIPRLYPALPDDARAPEPAADTSFGGLVANALGEASAALEQADSAERRFAAGRGGLQEMAVQRAQADIALSLASATATRATQALTTILGMQI
jgi:flagellar hook-basal body complex protein FliE